MKKRCNILPCNYFISVIQLFLFFVYFFLSIFMRFSTADSLHNVVIRSKIYSFKIRFVRKKKWQVKNAILNVCRRISLSTTKMRCQVEYAKSERALSFSLSRPISFFLSLLFSSLFPPSLFALSLSSLRSLSLSSLSLALPIFFALNVEK